MGLCCVLRKGLPGLVSRACWSEWPGLGLAQGVTGSGQRSGMAGDSRTSCASGEPGPGSALLAERAAAVQPPAGPSLAGARPLTCTAQWHHVVFLSLISEICICSAGGRWTSDEEDGAEPRPHRGARCRGEGGGPQHPATGPGGFVLYCWCHYREDCLVKAACKGWQIGLRDPLYHGI